MQQDFFKKLETSLSAERLQACGQDNPGSCTVMARYLWNMAIGETLYSPLQMCEIAMRNSIHTAMTELYKQDTWFNIAEMTPWGYEQIGSAKKKIAKTRHPITPGRVVAELHFGFWTSLFEDHYERNASFLPAGIKKVFPNMLKSLHNRKKIKARLENIRQLRNRVFHHERIIHWKDLQGQHGRILETVGWISHELEEMALKLDRFVETYKAGIDPWLKRLNHHWPARTSSPPLETGS